jgi:hypothetical protein
MDALPAEESSSNIPAERRELGGGLPSQESLDEILEGPREKAQFFNRIISERFPAGGRDKLKQKAEEQTARIVSGELNSYEHHWLKRHLIPINEEYQSIVSSSPETIPQRSELSFHIINQFIMPQWHRILVSPKLPRMNDADLSTAQVQLAIESAAILTAKKEFQINDFFDNELRDIDAMIDLLQLSIDGKLLDMPGVIAVPHPEIGSAHHDTDFLIFQPTHEGLFDKIEVRTEEVIDETRAPGSVAVDTLKNIRISTLTTSHPEFQNRSNFSKLLRARESVRTFNETANQPALRSENATKRISRWAIAHSINKNEA